MDWSACQDVETRPDILSGTWVVRGTRVPADAVIDNADDGFTAQEIVAEIYDTLPLAATQNVIAFARQHGAHPARP